MKVTAEKDEKVAKMTFASVYPHYLDRVVKNDRTKEELHQVIEWLTGYDETRLNKLIDEKVTFKMFYDQAEIHPNAHLIKGMICGYRIEDIEFELTRQARYLDKLIDELARGRKMDKILRQDPTAAK